MRTVLLALALVLAAPAPAAVLQPVAVLPFRNLNQDGSIEWLAKGIAETMVSDLKRSGNVRVVERDQLDRALTELVLQGAKLAEDSTAAQVGKLVGAKTVVVGSFQKAGAELRINARFVEVETGVVRDTAKATGPVTKVFALQDEVVDRLLGGKKPAARPVRKDGERTVKAYELWTKSLSGSDVDKVGLLKASLEQDPDFPYALEDLAALEKRIAAYRSAREGALPAQQTALWSRIEDTTLTGYERALGVDNLLKLRRDERRFRALLADAERILKLKIPDPPPGTIAPAHDAALWAKFEAQWMLRLRDDAVRTAETYLKRHPTGLHYKDVEEGLAELVNERRKRDGQLTGFYREQIEKIEARRAEEKEKLAGEDLDRRMVGLDGERCDFIWRFHLSIWEKLLEECDAVVRKYGSHPDARDENTAIGDEVKQARYRKAFALGELGRFDEAVPLMRELAREYDGEYMGRMAKETLEAEWPRDAAP